MSQTRWSRFRWTRGAGLGCVLVFLVSGCVGVWWKPGAGTQELDRDKAACRAEVADAKEFDACMSERGWWHSPGPGAEKTPEAATRNVLTPAPAAAARSSRGTESKASLPAARPGSDPGSPVVPVAPGTTPAAADRVSPAPAISVSTPAVAAETPASPASGVAPGDTDAPAPASGIFWKFAASAQELERDQATCQEQAGLRIERDSGPRWGESAGFDRCMCALGWRGGPC